MNKVAPERITQARELSGLTKSELASELNVTPAAIAQWENKSKQPTAANLHALSVRLKFPMQLFLREIPRSIMVRGPLTFRAWTAAASRKANRKAARMAELFAEVYLWLNERISFPSYCPPQIDHDASPSMAARQCRKSWNLSNRPILKLGELFESKGIVFGNTSFDDDRFDAFSCVIDGRPFIFLGNDKKDSARSRFDACHELAHLLLHQHLTESDLGNPAVLKHIENEAHEFAGAFLLPDESFAQDVLDISLDGFLKLKAKWAVSVQAMVVRAFHLGLITESQYGELFRQISFKGWRRKRGEPLDDLVPIVKRSLGQRSLELLELNKIVHAWEIPCVLPMPTAILCDVFQSDPEKFEPDELGKVIAVDFKVLPQSTQGVLEELA